MNDITYQPQVAPPELTNPLIIIAPASICGQCEWRWECEDFGTVKAFRCQIADDDAAWADYRAEQAERRAAMRGVL